MKKNHDRIQNDPIAINIVMMVSAMKADFGVRFTKQFPDSDAIRNFKRRLYRKLFQFKPEAIIEGYEELIDSRTEFCPTIPEIISHVQAADKKIRQAETAAGEAVRVAAVQQGKTIQVDSVKIMASAISAKNNLHNSLEARKKRMAELRQVINAQIIAADNVIRRYADDEHSCNVIGCLHAGSLSHGIAGGSPFYCAEHFRMPWP